MTDTRKTIDGDTETHWTSLCDGSPKPAADIGKPDDAENDADDMYPAEFLPVGDPRPNSE
jgi:hypothetical protein